jgi:hypothetical protein
MRSDKGSAESAYYELVIAPFERKIAKLEAKEGKRYTGTTVLELEQIVAEAERKANP